MISKPEDDRTDVEAIILAEHSLRFGKATTPQQISCFQPVACTATSWGSERPRRHVRSLHGDSREVRPSPLVPGWGRGWDKDDEFEIADDVLIRLDA